ncbi:hypothetical protein [Azorhizobium doebereinerae]|uniref:hypothetical protein n=1 Tax=Azorhizobium doebereinerae TaxID=281091 RepID=UPI0012EC8EB0|nr:hypothetical protein [Azorhizobium doebereinerae]
MVEPVGYSGINLYLIQIICLTFFVFLIGRFLLRASWGVSSVVWAKIELSWAAISIASLIIAVWQIGIRLNQIELQQLRVNFPIHIEAFKQAGITISQHGSDHQNYEDGRKILALANSPRNDREWRNVPKQYVGVRNFIDTGCVPMLGPKWSALELRAKFRNGSGDNSVTTEIMRWDERLDYCLLGDDVAKNAQRIVSLEGVMPSEQTATWLGAIWSMSISIGLALKLLKAFSDLKVSDSKAPRNLSGPSGSISARQPINRYKSAKKSVEARNNEK